MKQNRQYEINHINNTVTVTKSFMDAASQLDKDEFKLVQRFKEMGLTIHIKQRAPRKSPKTAKEIRITYDMMTKYIACLEDSEEMQKLFDATRQLSKSKPNPYRYMVKWFTEEFPQYGQLPEYDDNNRVVHNPNKIRLSA